MKPYTPQKIENSDPKTLFYAGVKRYWDNDKRGAFELMSRAMEKGLPKDREYLSDDHSELNAARFLVPILLRDDDGFLSQRTEPFWFEKSPESIGDAHKISAYIREIFLYVTGRGGVKRDLEKAADIAQDIVLELSFGDRDHDPAITLRSILQNAANEEDENGKVRLYDWI